jgi:hypothetical protein
LLVLDEMEPQGSKGVNVRREWVLPAIGFEPGQSSKKIGTLTSGSVKPYILSRKISISIRRKREIFIRIYAVVRGMGWPTLLLSFHRFKILSAALGAFRKYVSR